jgi:hypothetical protein
MSSDLTMNLNNKPRAEAAPSSISIRLSRDVFIGIKLAEDLTNAVPAGLPDTRDGRDVGR